MTERQERLLAWFLPMAALAVTAGVLLGEASAEPLYGWIALGCSGLAALLLKDRLRVAALLAVLCALGFVGAQAAYHPDLPEEGTYLVTGVVTGELRTGDNGQIKTILRHVTVDGEPAGDAYWSFYLAEGENLPEALVPGVQVTMEAQVYHPAGADNPGGFDFRDYLLQRNMTLGVYGRTDVRFSPAPFTLEGMAAQLRHSLAQGLSRAMGEEAGGYASAMLLGVQTLVPSEDRDAFSRLGIAHVLSISGFHVSVLASLMNRLLKRLRVSRKARLGCIGPALGAYCLLTGMSAPVLRAAILYILYDFGHIRNRQRSALHLLSGSYTLMLLLSPCQLRSASFQLTYAAMLGMTLVVPRMRSLWQPRRRYVEKAWSGLAASLGAQLGLLVPQMYWFQELPLLGLVLNLVVLYLFTWLMALYWLTLAFLFLPAVASWLGSAAALCTQGLVSAIRFLGQFDFVVLWTKQANLLTLLGWVLIMLGLGWITPLRGRKRLVSVLAGLAAVVVSLVPLPHTGTEYVQLSTGDADAAVLHDGDYVLAVDTGEDGKDLVQYLRQRRLSADAVIITHLHSDHAGGLAALMESRIPIGCCYLPAEAEACLIDPGMAELLEQLAGKGVPIRYLSRGDTLPLPSGSLRVLWPEAGKVRPGQDANLYSLTILAEVKGTTLLLTGDLDGTFERYAAVPADVLKAAHHGSSSSMGAEFLRAVAPEAIVVPTGTRDRLARVQSRAGDVPVYATENHGAILITFEDGAFAITTMK